MSMMESLEKAEKLLCKAVDDVIEHGDLNAPYMDYLGKATDALKDIYTLREKMNGGSYERENYERYMADYSRGRRRDSMGRYMDDGYSADRYGHEDEKEFLRWKMQNASSDQERERIRRKLESM